MLCQIGQLGDRYEEWVNSPVDRRIKFFDNAFYEMFTETPWYVIIIFWMPIVSAVMFIEVTSERFQVKILIYVKNPINFMTLRNNF